MLAKTNWSQDDDNIDRCQLMSIYPPLIRILPPIIKLKSFSDDVKAALHYLVGVSVQMTGH